MFSIESATKNLADCIVPSLCKISNNKSSPRFNLSMEDHNKLEKAANNFVQRSLREIHSPLKRPLELVRFHDGDVKKSMRWWTTPEWVNRCSTLQEVRASCAILPKWSAELSSVTLARIPRDAEVYGLKGRAKPQHDLPGYAEQIYIANFQPQWILETRKISNNQTSNSSLKKKMENVLCDKKSSKDIKSAYMRKLEELEIKLLKSPTS